MKCPKCQFENSETAKFCNECGNSFSPSSKTTPQLHSYDDKLQKIQRYLPNGLSQKIFSQRDKIEGERKNVTIMFCDMVGYTHLVDRLGLEDTYSFMDKIYEILIQKVHEFGGTINELTGDGIIALFGAPIAIEDAPSKAVWSAQSIHREIDKLNIQKIEIMPIKMRIGIHTGPVIVGTLGNDLRVEFKAVGNTVNLTSRMEEMAEPGSTYATEEIFKLTRGICQFKAMGQRTVKGKKELIPVYKVLSDEERGYRPRLGTGRMIFSQMVGRNKELKSLELQVRKIINGEGSIINIIGEAGIGKSRLVAELKKKELMQNVTLIEGRAITIGRNLSFHPIIDLLKQWAQIRENDNEKTALNKLEAALGNLYPEGVKDVLPFIATLIRMKLLGSYKERIKGIEGEALEKLILRNVRELIIKATERTPLIIIIEDLHWADASSIDLMESLFRLAETQKILFINMFRPGYKETGERIVETTKERLQKYYLEIRLNPLNERDSEMLVTSMLDTGEIRHAIIRKIVNRASGNPFFIEEVVRSFIDEGVVEIENGSFRVTDKIDYVTIPETIQNLICARVDRLDEDIKDLIKVASVIGPSFFYKILTEVVKSDVEVDGKLQYLKEVQLIQERERMGEIEYVFKHGLTQEVTYESLLLNNRKELHLKVANAIESEFKDKLHLFYGILAYHYSKGNNLVKTEEFLIKSGKEALKSSASYEALNYYQEALRLYLILHKYENNFDPEKISMLQKNIALAFFNKGQYAEAINYIDSILDNWGISQPKRRIDKYFRYIVNLLSLVAELYLPRIKRKQIPNKKDHEIFDLFEKKLTSLAFLHPKRYFNEFLSAHRWTKKLDITQFKNGVSRYSSVSTVFSWTGISFKLSRKILDHVKPIINKKDAKDYLRYNLYELYLNFFEGRWKKYQAYDQQIIEENLTLGEIWNVSTYLFFICSIKIDIGAFEESEKLIRKITEIWETYENENTQGYIYSLNAKLLMKLRKFEEFHTEIDKAITFATRVGRRLFELSYLGYKAKAYILTHDIKNAKECLMRATKLQLKDELKIPHFMSSKLLGRFLLDIHQLEEIVLSIGRSRNRKYRKIAQNSGKEAMRNLSKYACNKTEIFRLKGIYFWLLGEQNKAVAWWKESINAGKDLGDRVELARTYMEIGRRFLEKKSNVRELYGLSSENYLDEARKVFEELNLLWDLEELSKFMAFKQKFAVPI